jgi:hypothetical protein
MTKWMTKDYKNMASNFFVKNVFMAQIIKKILLDTYTLENTFRMTNG